MITLEMALLGIGTLFLMLLAFIGLAFWPYRKHWRVLRRAISDLEI